MQFPSLRTRREAGEVHNSGVPIGVQIEPSNRERNRIKSSRNIYCFSSLLGCVEVDGETGEALVGLL